MRTALRIPHLARRVGGGSVAPSDPGGVPLLPRQLGAGSRLLIEVAWGADPTGDPARWSWTDVTRDARLDDGEAVEFSYGRPDWVSQSSPARGSLTFFDPAGKYSIGGYSPNWPNVKINVPIRVRADVNGTGFNVLFQGNIVGLEPTWDETGRVALMAATLAGTMERLDHPNGTGQELSCPQRFMLSASPTPVVYFPLNDGSQATFGRALITSGAGQNGTPIAEVRPGLQGVTASPYLGQGRIATWLDEGASLKENAAIVGFVPLSPYQTVQFVGGVLCSFASGDGEVGDVWEFGLAENASAQVTWALVADCAARTVSISDGNSLVVTQPEEILFDGQPHYVVLETTKVGSDTYFVALCDGISFISYVATGRPFQHVWSMLLFNSSKTERSFAHLGAWVNGFVPDVFDTAYQMLGANLHTELQGFTENAIDRIKKLRAQSGERVEIIGPGTPDYETAVMGVQPTDDLLSAFRRCEAADQGMLYDGGSSGLTYITRGTLECQTASITVDVATRQLYPAFRPRFDTQRRVNVATALKLYGSQAIYERTDGLSGTAAIGPYDGSIEVNIDDDARVLDFAGWLTNLGTAEGYQFPEVSFNVGAVPELAYRLSLVRPGQRLDLVNARTVFATFPLDTVELLIEGVAMTVQTEGEWIISLQCSLYEPWRIIVAAADTGDTGEFVGRYESDGTYLGATAVAGATSFNVFTPTGPLWTTAADDFPMIVLLGEVPVRVTAISAPVGTTQTITCDPLPVTKSAGSEVRMGHPGVLRMGGQF
jgi:hypothetical protein